MVVAERIDEPALGRVRKHLRGPCEPPEGVGEGAGELFRHVDVVATPGQKP